jgi:hypothetical protein
MINGQGVIIELESHTSQQALIPQHESKLGEEPTSERESMARACDTSPTYP